jgi:hypothetical protein
MCDDFCLVHGYEHMMRNSIFDKVAYCAECERERQETAAEIEESVRFNNAQDSDTTA